MEQETLFKDQLVNDHIDLGANLSIKYLKNSTTSFHYYIKNVIIKKVDISDKIAKKLFIVDAVEQGACQSRLAEALDISRQTIHNYLQIKKHFGYEGLIQRHSDSSGAGKWERSGHKKDKKTGGNKAELVAEIRKREREERESKQLEFEFSFMRDGKEEKLKPEEEPFAEEHGWEESRYAGVFLYLITLINGWNWLRMVTGFFGASYKILMIFILMAARNIRSIEQLKNVRSREAGLAVGIGRIGSRPSVWSIFYDAARKRVSESLLVDFFRRQIRTGVVGCWLWFTDGHLLPYTGREKVRSGYHTQRRMPFPGQTNLVTCDASGRVVDFEIQEGKGDLRGRILTLPGKWEDETPVKPVMVFDREGSGAGFFSELVMNNIPFVTWEKNVKEKELDGIDDDLFAEEFEFNGKRYGMFEGEKTIVHEPEGGPRLVFTLRRIFIWNRNSNKRVCGLAWPDSRKAVMLDEPEFEMDAIDCAKGILSRWGASENTFKHQASRHPLHYRPGFKLVESEKQEIANPEIKEKEGLIRKLRKTIDKLLKKAARLREVFNKDGSPRENSAMERTRREIAEKESELKKAREEKKELPEKIDVSALEDYRTFKRIDNEGKNLFDFALTSVWNARKQMIDWLRPYFDAENELVDLFYAITDCHGWIRSTREEVIVRLEPLQQPKRREAQVKLCRKLTALLARTTNNKRLVIEVGEPPGGKVSKKNGGI